jgi:hypothetical protein
MSALNTAESEGRSNDLHELWGEALWGVGLIGSVLLLVALIAAIFGR